MYFNPIRDVGWMNFSFLQRNFQTIDRIVSSCIRINFKPLKYKIYSKEAKKFPRPLMPHCQPVVPSCLHHHHSCPCPCPPHRVISASYAPALLPMSSCSQQRGLVPWPGHLGDGAGAGLHSSSPLSPSSEDPPMIHPTSSCLWTCGGCWFVMGGHQCEAAGKRGVGCIPALYRPPSVVPSHHHLFPSPPLSFPPLFITQGVACLFSG